MRLGVFGLFGLTATLLSGATTAQPAGLLLVDAARRPTITISSGGVSHSAVVPYTAPDDARPVGPGLTGYAALGGIRLETGQGDPAGAIVRVGFTREDETDFIAPGSAGELTLELSGVFFDRPVRIDERSVMVHLRLDEAGTQSCGLAARDRGWMLTTDPGETLDGRLEDGWDSRLGALADVEMEIDAERNGVTARITLPADLLKHPRDPSLLDTPGAYAEPEHLHLEFQVLPADLPE